MRTSASILAILFTGTVAIPPAYAQTTHAAPPSAIDAALQQHADASRADRAAVLRLLARDEVKEIAGKAGLDLRRAQSAVRTLSGADLAQLASQARQAERGLAGGQSTITISTTLIIIALLVIILIVVAV